MNRYKKHVNLDYLYKVLSIQLRDMSSFALEKKEKDLPKGSLVFTIINLSYLVNEFHCKPTPDLLMRYVSLSSHNLFFFNETIFNSYSNKREEEQKQEELYSEEASGASEEPDQPELDLLEKIRYSLMEGKEIKNGFISVNKSNKFVVLVFKTNKNIPIKRMDLKNKLSKENYISTIDNNIVKSSHAIYFLDLYQPILFLDLVDIKLFLDPSKKLKVNDTFYDDVIKYYKEEVDDEKYSQEFVITQCTKVHKSIYS